MDSAKKTGEKPVTYMDELDFAKRIVKDGTNQSTSEKSMFKVKEFGQVWTFHDEEFDQLNSNFA